MPKFGKTSRDRLDTCHEDLQLLFQKVVNKYDCYILCGYRSQKDQMDAFASHRSKVTWPNSKHNLFPSVAVDVVPYPIDWGETGTESDRRKAIARFYHFAGYVLRTADEMGIEIRWGGDWDGDKNFSDQNFDDLPHWELK